MIKIVTDSGCDYTENMKNKNGINIEKVPLTMQLGDKVFVDDENLDMEKYLLAMDICPQTPKTAAPSPQSYLDKFRGDESIFAITLSSHLSGSHNSALLAKEMYNEDIGEKFIHVFDSFSASAGETLVALKINECHYKNLNNEEIVENVNDYIKNLKIYFMLEKFDTLVKSGRMNPYVAKIASMLSFKPICCGIDGKIAFLDKARGYKKAVSRLIELIKAEKVDFENRTLGITHVQAYDKALSFKEEICKIIKFKDALIMEATGLCSTYANREGLIVAF